MTNCKNKIRPVLVPQWVALNLRRHNLPLNTVLNLNKMSSISSQEDLAILFDLNFNPQKVFGVPNIASGLIPYWSKNNFELNSKLLQILPLYEGKSDARLYACSSENNPLTVIDDGDACNAFTITYSESGLDTDNIILIVINPGYFGGLQSNNVQQKLRRSYLKQLYVFSTSEEVAKDPVFSTYLFNV